MASQANRVRNIAVLGKERQKKRLPYTRTRENTVDEQQRRRSRLALGLSVNQLKLHKNLPLPVPDVSNPMSHKEVQQGKLPGPEVHRVPVGCHATVANIQTKTPYG